MATDLTTVRRSEPDGARAAIDGIGGGEAGLLHGVGEGGRAGPARAVGRRGHDRTTEGRDHGPGPGVAGHPHGDAVEPGAGQIADAVAVPHRGDDGQRAGPERFGQGPGLVVEHGDGLGLDRVGDMGDQWIEAGAALGLEQGGDGDGVAGIGGQTIDGLGRQDDQTPGGQRLGRLGVGRA